MTRCHTVEQWVEIFTQQLHAHDGQAVANRILSDLYGYNHKSKHRDGDVHEMGKALEAWLRVRERQS